MIVPSLYADLRVRGVSLSIARTPDMAEAPELLPLRLHIRAPGGVLDASFRAALEEHRDELLQFVFELEETAAILAVMQGNRIEESAELARDCVRGGRAAPDGQLWLNEYAARHPQVAAVREIFGAEIIGVERLAPEASLRMAQNVLG